MGKGARMTGIYRGAGGIFSLLLLVCGGSWTQAHAQTPRPRDDTQVWTDVQLAVPIHKQVDFVLTGTVRFGRDVSRPVDERIGFGFSYKAGKYLTLAPSYVYIRAQPFQGRNTSEDRLIFAATLRAPLGKFTLSDRNQFERRYRHAQGVSERYRNRLQIEHPFKIGDTQLNWYIADEIQYDWAVDDWSRNRFTIGVSRKFNKYFTNDLYYLRQSDGRSFPGDLNVIGTAFKFRL